MPTKAEIEALCAELLDLAEENERLKLQRDEAREQFDMLVTWASDQEAAAEARAIAAEGALKDVLASLVAARSLLSRAPKTVAPSNTMFDMMLSDYAASIERGRAALAQKEGG